MAVEFLPMFPSVNRKPPPFVAAMAPFTATGHGTNQASARFAGNQFVKGIMW